MDRESAICRARCSLEGLALGDAFGELYYQLYPRFTPESDLPAGPWAWTDDTHMALSVVEILARYGEIEQDALARAFARRYMEEPHRGYARGAHRLLPRIHAGADWRVEAPSLFRGGSYGNGAAMRAAPVGACFVGNPAKAAEEARKSSVVTHAHPEGQAGAMAVAVAAALAESAAQGGRRFLKGILEYAPESQVAEGIRRSLEIPTQEPYEAIRKLGTGQRVSAQDTVPFCLWVAAHHRDDYQAALWTTAKGLGDCDTTCAIVGGIVGCSVERLPKEWLARREPMPRIRSG